jgi:hypothetical protein
MSETPSKKTPGIERIAGAGLVLIGIFFFLNNYFDFRLGDVLWPFFIIVPGVLIFAFSLNLTGEAGAGLAVAGSMVTMAGLLLLYQNTFDHYESWAYAWALVAPTAVGLGQVFYGSLKRLPDLVSTGRRTVTVGVVIFAIGAFFFEVILGISGLIAGMSEYIWPLVLIGLGVFVLVRNLRSNPGREKDAADEREP